MSTYSVGGKGHRILARLEDGEATGGELIDIAAGIGGDHRKRRKSWNILKTLRDDGLAWVDGGFYRITQDGADALTCLRSGRDAVIETAVPTVRVFVERRRAA